MMMACWGFVRQAVLSLRRFNPFAFATLRTTDRPRSSARSYTDGMPASVEVLASLERAQPSTLAAFNRWTRSASRCLRASNVLSPAVARSNARMHPYSSTAAASHSDKNGAIGNVESQPQPFRTRRIIDQIAAAA